MMIFLGFYPKPALDVINPAVARTLQYVGVTDPPATHPSPTQSSAVQGAVK